MREPTVFVNHRRGDVPWAVTLLDTVLCQRFGDDRVFYDRRSVVEGLPFGPPIDRALETCAVVVTVIGPGWLRATDAHGRRRLDDRRDWVRRELVTALRRAVPVLAVLVDETPDLRAEALPAPLRPLAGMQWARLDHCRTRCDLDVVVRAVESLSAVPADDAA